jgi:hypothetical protein
MPHLLVTRSHMEMEVKYTAFLPAALLDKFNAPVALTLTNNLWYPLHKVYVGPAVGLLWQRILRLPRIFARCTNLTSVTTITEPFLKR